MRIGLFDVDSHNFPNLPLMKLSAWHKSRGDTVEWWDPDDGRYSIVYASKVFTESVLPATLIVKGLKTIEQVPSLIKSQVEEILVALEVEV